MEVAKDTETDVEATGEESDDEESVDGEDMNATVVTVFDVEEAGDTAKEKDPKTEKKDNIVVKTVPVRLKNSLKFCVILHALVSSFLSSHFYHNLTSKFNI